MHFNNTNERNYIFQEVLKTKENLTQSTTFLVSDFLNTLTEIKTWWNLLIIGTSYYIDAHIYISSDAHKSGQLNA